MEIQYVYVKSRSQFGKQCIFDDSGITIEENIVSNPEIMASYLYQDPVDTGVQNSRQTAAHEAQTISATTKDSGMHHTEGGWPKEVNIKDEEAVARFRRRVEKSDTWAPKVRNLMMPMEKNILQNNTVNIYEHYFDDMIPTELVLPLGLRTVNVYEDPQVVVRPVTHLAWSPDNGKRLAAAYCSMEFQKVPLDLNPYSYIWNIENPNKPFMALKAVHPSVTIEFNPRDPSMLISGLMSGQVCNWDIRSGNTPIQLSHPQFSHRNPTNCALWINSKTNTEFFSASTGGVMNWWDIRMLRQPTESLIMDLENPLRGDVVRAIGVSALQFESTMGTKFMAGMENGLVISGTRKGKNAAEKLALRFNCHYGPVVGIDRNPFSTKNFLTIGDWTARIWAEDTREGNLVSTRHHKTALTGGCWSTSRCSVFYVINDEGMMEVFDILVGLNNPVTTIRLCEDSLKVLAPHESGKLVAVGSDKGKVYLVESSEALTTMAKNDKMLLTSYFDRCSRYEKSIDSRLREIRLAQKTEAIEVEPPLPPPSPPKGKGKAGRKGTPSGKQDKEKKIDDKSSKMDEKERKKLKQNKPKNAWEALGDPELADVERQYFEILQQEMEKYARASGALGEESDVTASTLATSRVPSSVKRKKQEDSRGDKDVGKVGSGRGKVEKSPSVKDKSPEIIVIKKVPDSVALSAITIHDESRFKISEDDTDEEEESDKEEEEKDIMSKRKTYFQEGSSLLETKPCEDEICEPTICCLDKIGSADRIGDKDDESTIQTEDLKIDAAIVEMLAGLPKNVLPSQPEDLPHYTMDEKRKILAVKDAPPLILSGMVKEAKRGVKDLRKMIERGKFESSTIGKFNTIEDEALKKTEFGKTVLASVGGGVSEDSMRRRDLSASMKSLRKILRKKPQARDPCEPIVKKFDSKDIHDIIGIDVKLPKDSSSLKKEFSTKSETENYPRISAFNMRNKKSNEQTE